MTRLRTRGHTPGASTVAQAVPTPESILAQGKLLIATSLLLPFKQDWMTQEHWRDRIQLKVHTTTWGCCE